MSFDISLAGALFFAIAIVLVTGFYLYFTGQLGAALILLGIWKPEDEAPDKKRNVQDNKE